MKEFKDILSNILVTKEVEEVVEADVSKDIKLKLKDLSTAQYMKLAEALYKAKSWARYGGGSTVIFYLTKPSSDPSDDPRVLLHQNGKWEFVGNIFKLK
jgi:hypothetical protein